MKPVLLLVVCICLWTTTAFSCVPPVVDTYYSFQVNVTEISERLGSYIRVECRIADPDSDVTLYVWQRNGENIEEPSLFSYYLTIQDLSAEDGGQYRCEVATAACGNAYSTEISIYTPPDSVVISGPTTVAVGHSFQLTCSSNGWPLPNYTWRLNGVSVGGVGGVYSVSSAVEADAGDYTCVATNSRGQTEDSVTLNVSAKVLPSTSVVSGPTQESAKLPMSTYRDSSVAKTKSVSSTPGPSATDEGHTEESSGAPTAPFIVLLALSIALLLSLVGVLIMIFVSVIWVLKTRSSHKKEDRERLIEEEEGEGEGEGEEGGKEVLEMKEGDPGNQANQFDMSPPSCVNVTFGPDNDQEEEDEEEDLRNEGPLLTVSPQQYQQQSSGLKLGSRELHRPSSYPSSAPHSVSTNLPQAGSRKREEAGPAAEVSSIPRGDPGKMSHLTPPTDRHKVGHQKNHHHKSKGKVCPSSDSDRVQLLAAMETCGEKADQLLEEEPTALTLHSVEEKMVPGEETAMSEEKEEMEERRERREEKGERREEKEEWREEELKSEKVVEGERVEEEEKDGWVKDKMEMPTPEPKVEEGCRDVEEDKTTFIGEVEEEEEGKGTTEEETEETAVVVQQEIGEVTVTFEQEGDTGDEDSVTMVLEDTRLSSEEGGGEGSGHPPRQGGRNDSPRHIQSLGEKAVEAGRGGEEGEKEVEAGRGGEGGEKEGGEVEKETVISEAQAPETVATKEPSSDENKDTKDPDIHEMTVFVEKARKMGRTPLIAELDRSHPLSVEELQELVEEALTGVKGNRLTLEYKTVPHNSVKALPLTVEEKRKNRYRNVLPNPFTAVRLSDTGVAGSQYINANYIRGYGDKEDQYIATQGPTTNTLADFWRMVWEKDVSIIVMTTSLVENGSQKCVKYWPRADDSDTVMYGNMVVRNNYEEVTESYITSYLSISPQSPDGRETGEERDIYHFWHTAWCDFGVPRETGSILRLREAVDAFRVPTSGPVLVHCSAGLGRSGTFMAIDMGIQQYEAEGVVDPLKYMCDMRQDRGGIIQTADQYTYIHRALRDYITS